MKRLTEEEEEEQACADWERLTEQQQYLETLLYGLEFIEDAVEAMEMREEIRNYIRNSIPIAQQQAPDTQG